MPTSLIYSREAWESRLKESNLSEQVEPPALGIDLSENKSLLNRDPGRKKSSGDVVATVKEPQKNPVSTQITERQQQDSAPQQNLKEGSKNMMELETKANQHLGGSIEIDTKAHFESHFPSNCSWHNDAHHYSHRRNMMRRM